MMLDTRAFPHGEEHLLWEAWLSRTWFPSVMVAEELQVFSYLEEVPATAAEVARALRLNPRALRSVLALLASLGILRAREGVYDLAPLARTYLISDSPFYWGGILAQTRGFDTVATRVRKVLCAPPDETSSAKPGSSWADEWTARTLTEEAAADIARFMQSHSAGPAVRLAETGLFGEIDTLLEVGAGSGCYSIAIARMHPHVRCLLAELPQACDTARRYVREAGLPDRIEVHGLDMFRHEWPLGHNAVLMSNVLHDWPRPRAEELIARAHESLPRGGTLYLHEALLDEDGGGPRTVAALSVLVMLGTPGGQFMRRELLEMLNTAGFLDPQVLELPPLYSLICARKA